jgi:hypothetical protein
MTCVVPLIPLVRFPLSLSLLSALVLTSFCALKGKILRLDIKEGGFAFIEYGTAAEANEAINSVDGQLLKGRRITVQMAKGSNVARLKRTGGRGNFRVDVKGLDPKTSWQDLKDFARSAAAGPISFCDVWMEAGKKYGVVEYLKEADMDTCIKKLNKTLLYVSDTYVLPWFAF